MNLTASALRRPWTVLVAVIAVALTAWLALQRMTRDVFPPLGVPTIYVAQPYGGMDPAQMEGFLTYYYEYHFLYITGIEHVESKTIQGASIMKLQFHPETDMSQAMAETVSYVNRARAFMPPGTPLPFTTRFDAGSVPVGQLVFSTENPARTVGQMQDAALNMVRPLFATLPGVSAPPPFGGSARTIVINAQPDRLQALSLSPDELVQAVAQANVISPSGNIQLGDSYPIVPVNALVKNIKDLESVPLRTTENGAIFLRDVATVDDQSDLVTSYALVNGRRTVYMPVTKRSDASTLEVVRLVRENLSKFQAAVPEDVRVSLEFDQTPVVLRSIRDLIKEGLLGAGLTGLMVLLFLRSVRSALIVVLNIPVALMAAVVALWVSGQNIHLMTLGGLALAVGILVDEATVAIESIAVHRSRGIGVRSAVVQATAETAGPRLLAMLCVLAVFIPALFMTGPAKALFTPLALAVGFSMVASFVLSSTLVPVLCAWWIQDRPAATQESNVQTKTADAEGKTVNIDEKMSPGMTGEHRFWLSGLHRLLVRPLIASRWVSVPAYLAAVGAVVWHLGPRLRQDIFPAAESGQVAVRLRAPAGTRLDVTEKLALRALELLKNEAGPDKVALTIGLVGVHASNYPVNLIHHWNGGPEEAWFGLEFKQGSGIRVADFQERMRAVLSRELPQLRVSFEPADIVSRVMSLGASTPIEVAVSGPSLADSRAHAEKLLPVLKALPQLRDVQISQELDYPALPVEVNRERAGLLGVREADVTRSLVAATTSSRFTLPNYWADTKTGVSYSLQVQIPQAKMAGVEELKNIPVAAGPAGSGKTQLLRNIATIGQGAVPGQYERYNMARVVSITANFHGTDLASAAQAVERAIIAAGAPPPKTKVDLRGQIVPLRELIQGFRQGLGVAVAALLLLLIAAFQSWRCALSVVAALPAVLAGSIATLSVMGSTLNIQSAIGIIMALGVAVANGILLVSAAERSRKDGLSPQDAALAGATSRLRAIVMTSAAMLAGMLPMALGLGESGAQVAPLGRAVIGGLAAATLATLLITPAVYAWLSPRHYRDSSLLPS